MDTDLLKALLRPKKRAHYLAKIWSRKSLLDPSAITAGCIAAGISSLGYRYLNKYPILIDPNGGAITRHILRTGHYSYELMEVFCKIYPNRDVRFINIGANIGTSILNAYEAGFRDFVAFEPVSQNFALLKHNLAGITADLRQQGVGDAKGVMEINLNRSSSGRNSFIDNFGEGIEAVEVVTLDDVANDQPSFLWIDTEGYEVHVLRGAEKYLSRNVEGLCVEISPDLLGPNGLSELEDILKRHFSRFFLSSGESITALDLASLTAAGRQIDLLALR